MKELRLKAGLTQEQLSEVSGISYKYLQSIETGKTSNLRLKTINKIALAFGVSISQLFAIKSPSIKVPKIKVRQPHKPRKNKNER
jgi:transcriptional regulator with XRE-family HTH domain